MIADIARQGMRAARALALAAGFGVGWAAGAAAQTLTMPVPTATVYPGDFIDPGIIGERTFRQSQVAHGFVDSRSMLAGKIARRTLLPNHPIPLNAIDEVDLVTRGTPVQLVFRQAGLVITAYASPLEDGSEGDVIRVRNADSGAVVMGVVQVDGTVRVGAP
jgi:flagella basal body P-ring formation protein FlgA